MHHTLTVRLATQPAPIYQFLGWLHGILGDGGYTFLLLAVLLVVLLLLAAVLFAYATTGWP